MITFKIKGPRPEQVAIECDGEELRNVQAVYGVAGVQPSRFRLTVVLLDPRDYPGESVSALRLRSMIAKAASACERHGLQVVYRRADDKEGRLPLMDPVTGQDAVVLHVDHLSGARNCIKGALAAVDDTTKDLKATVRDLATVFGGLLDQLDHPLLLAGAAAGTDGWRAAAEREAKNVAHWRSRAEEAEASLADAADRLNANDYQALQQGLRRWAKRPEMVLIKAPQPPLGGRVGSTVSAAVLRAFYDAEPEIEVAGTRYMPTYLWFDGPPGPQCGRLIAHRKRVVSEAGCRYVAAYRKVDEGSIQPVFVMLGDDLRFIEAEDAAGRSVGGIPWTEDQYEVQGVPTPCWRFGPVYMPADDGRVLTREMALTKTAIGRVSDLVGIPDSFLRGQRFLDRFGAKDDSPLRAVVLDDAQHAYGRVHSLTPFWFEVAADGRVLGYRDDQGIERDYAAVRAKLGVDQNRDGGLDCMASPLANGGDVLAPLPVILPFRMGSFDGQPHLVYAGHLAGCAGRVYGPYWRSDEEVAKHWTAEDKRAVLVSKDALAITRTDVLARGTGLSADEQERQEAAKRGLAPFWFEVDRHGLLVAVQLGHGRPAVATLSGIWDAFGTVGMQRHGVDADPGLYFTVRGLDSRGEGSVYLTLKAEPVDAGALLLRLVGPVGDVACDAGATTLVYGPLWFREVAKT